MKKNLAKRLIVASLLTTWVANPLAVLAVDAHTDISGNGQVLELTGATGIAYDGLQGGVVSATDNATVKMSGTYENNSSISQGGALSLFQANGQILTGTKFINNFSANAGAISSSFSNLTIGDNVEFNGNYSNAYAGAILNQSSNLTIGNGVRFINNASNKNGGSDSGGALAIESNSPTVNSTVLIGENAYFKGNSTGRSGGAIYVFESSGTINLNIGDGATFIENEALGTNRNGGAIAVYGGSGGTGSTKGVVIGKNAQFSGNTANGSGGAVYVSNWNNDETVFEIGSGSTFSGNKATNGDGGAIYNACETVIDNGTFTSNESGVDGGAIYNTGAVASMIVENSSFDSNTAGDWGGAIGSFGGASLNVESSAFTNNIANTTGGAIASGKNSSLSISDVQFVNNHALRGDGGAIGSFGTLNIDGAIFEGNTAQLIGENFDTPYTGDPEAIGGGAIALGAQSTTEIRESIITNTIFRNNKSGTNGGAIATRTSDIADNSAATLTVNATFEGNEAAGDGGAVYNTFYSSVDGKGVSIVGKFINNTAGGAGGAIYNDGSVDKAGNNGGLITILGGSVFEDNKATTGAGGAIFTSADSKMTLDTNAGDILFSNNSSNDGANDIYAAAKSATDVVGSKEVSIGSGITTEADSVITAKDTSALVIEKTATANIAGSISTETGANVENNGTMTVTGAGSGNLTNNSTLNIEGTGSYIGKIVQKETSATINVSDGATLGSSETIEAGVLSIANGGKIDGTLSVAEEVEITIDQGATLTSSGISVGTGFIKAASGDSLNLKNTDLVASGNLSTDLILKGDSQFITSLDDVVIDGAKLTISNGSTNATNGKDIVVNTGSTLQLAPDNSSSATLNANVSGNGTVLVDEIVTQIDNPNFNSSLAPDPVTNPEKIDKHWGVGTVNIASDNSGFTGNFIQKMGNVIAQAGSKFFGGNNSIEGGSLTVQKDAVLTGTNVVSGGSLNLQNGAILANNVSVDENAGSYGTVNLYNEIKGSIVDVENPNAVIIAADEIANGNNGLLTYINADANSTEKTIMLNDGVGLGLFNKTTIQGDIALNSNTGVKALALGNGSGIISDDPAATLAINLGNGTSLSYFDGAVIQDNSTVQLDANSKLNFNNNNDSITYNPVVTSTASSSSINKNGAGAVTINSSLAGFTGSVNTTGGSLNIANTDSINLNNINANNSVLTIAGDVTANNANFKGSNSVINLKGASQFANVTMTDATLNAANSISIDNNLTIGATSGNIPTINLMGDSVNTITADTINLNGNANIAFDANPRSSTTDSIIANNIITNGSTGDPYKLLITGINFTESPIDRNVNIDIANLLSDSTGSQSAMVALKDGGVVANSEMGRYLITSSGASNALNASLLQLNPQMHRGQVATIASWQNQLVVNNMLFDHMQVVTRQLMDEEKTANKYAAAYPQFAPYQYSAKDGNLWYKAYGVFEKLSMTRGLNVGNNAYGSLIGADFPLVDLKNGWKLIPTAYVGYNGGHQHFNGVSMYQNGAQLGLMGTAYKGDFLTSLLAYGGGYGNDMTIRGQYGNGSDNTGNWFAGVASKTAYNFHIAKDLIFQPTALVSYNAFGSQNWGSSFGAMSMSTGMLNGINAAPGFNLIWQKKSFSLYATAQMVYNIMGGVDGQAGNIDTGYVRMKHAYFEYGIGAMKQLKDRFSGYLQITIRNGGRTGIGFQGGLNWKIGRK